MADRYTFTGKDGVERTFVGERPPTPAEMAAIEKTESKTAPPSTSGLNRLAEWLPTIGGMAGGVAGGSAGTAFGMTSPGATAGAAVGGMAGQGYKQLLQHATELPGAVSDVASNLFSQPGATLQGAAQGMAQGAKDTGLEGGLQALYELGGKAVTGALSAGGRAVYRGYLKPSLSGRLLAKASEIVETGVKEAIPVTDAGLAKASQLTSELKAEVERVLSTTKGDVDLGTVADKVRAFAKAKYFRPGRPSADFDAAMKVADELDSHASLPTTPGAPVAQTTTSPILNASGQPVTSTRMVPGPPVPQTSVSLSKANSIKQGIDEAIGETNFGVDRGAVKTSQKVARRGMRQAIEAQAPEVGPLNEREGKLIDLTNALKKATGREANRNQLFGMPTLAAGATGAAELAAGSGRYGAGAMALAMRMGLTPTVATRAAIIAAKMGDQLPGTAVADVARIAVQAVSQSGQQ